MYLWEKALSSPGVPFVEYSYSDNMRHFHLVTKPTEHSILSNLAVKGLGYNNSTPGPVIVVKQGEYVSIKVENRMNEPTALHVHGLSKPNSQDGAPDIEPATPKIMPGESYTYKFLAWQAGTFLYHSGMVNQIPQGLMGAFIVLPKDNGKPDQVPDRDYILTLQQWEIPQPKLGKVYAGIYKPAKFDKDPNFFTINGKAFPDSQPLYVKYGERIRIRFINKSSSSHTMHLHGHDFHVVAEDGFPRGGYMLDTINVPSGKRFDVEFIANNPGIWPLNGTKSFHQSNNGEAPGGMIAKIVYER
jgi:manganese oxidase